MKILIVEDEFISRTLLSEMLSVYGTCHITTNGQEAVEVLERSYQNNDRYDLVCLDIMMPEIDGQEVLTKLRQMEEDHGILEIEATKVIMTTALDDSKSIMRAFTEGHCEAYLTKPIDKDKLINQLKDLMLIP
ncbi:MAG: response regulator [Desulfobulbaceae bacterium]|nr:MAG: response regulator [Desulfobulbaceae bacterium]